MKKRMYLFIALLAGVSGLYAQDCATGYCPTTIVIHHKIGDLSAETKDITYNVVKITATTSPTCWITQNLGAPSTPTSLSDYGVTSNGWSYQLMHKQGYVNNTFTNTALITTSWTTSATVWPSDQDPCTLTFGAQWRMPTIAEYTANGTLSWASSAKLNHAPTGYYTGSTWASWYAGGGTGGSYWCRDFYLSSTSYQVWGDNGSGYRSWTAIPAPDVTVCTGVANIRCLKLASN